MSDEKVVIEASRLGLPATASASEIRDKVHGLKGELDAMTADRNQWRERAEENQATLVRVRGAEEENKSLKGELLIQAARDADKIDDHEVDHYRKLYKLSPELCAERIEGLRERRYLRQQESLKGPIGDPPNDIKAEMDGRCAEVMAADKSITLKSEAMRKVLNADAKFKERWDNEFSPSKARTEAR